jgi:hypothetical protein
MIIFNTGRIYNGHQVIAAEMVQEGIVFSDPSRMLDGFISVVVPYEVFSQRLVLQNYDGGNYSEASGRGYDRIIEQLRKAANEHSARRGNPPEVIQRQAMSAPAPKEPEREPYLKVPLYEIRNEDGDVVEYLYSDGLALAYYAMIHKHGDTAKNWTVRTYTGPSMTRDDYIHACHQMETEGGHFVTHLAKAYYHADGTNVKKLKRAIELEFDNLFRQYHQKWIAAQVRSQS